MSVEIAKGTRFKVKIYRNGGSFVVAIPPSLCEYLEIGEGSDCVLVAEHSKKYGNYAGFGKSKETAEVK